MNKSIYLVVSSKDSLQFFPSNKANHFTTLLSTPLDLSGTWNVGLKEIVFNVNGSLSSPRNVREYLMFDVYLSQASGCILSGVESMLLHRFFYPISKGEKTVAVSFNSVNMIPLKSSYIDRTDIIIKQVTDTSVMSVDEEATAHATLLLERL